jgi:hypothetical protein
MRNPQRTAFVVGSLVGGAELTPVAAQVPANACDDHFLRRGFESARRRHDPAEGK